MNGLWRQNRGAILAWGQPATQNSAVCVCGRTWQMLTFFTTAKPFQGHSGIIQRNALRSWVRACPDVEVILFGDEEGAAEIAVELGIRHEPHVARNEFGTKRLDAMFARAQEIARHDVLCYVNCDIILPEEFCAALERVRASHVRFLMVGRRWDTNVTQPMDFADVDWGMRVKRLAREQGEQQPGWSVDYFAFPRGMYAEMPELVVGRVWWDHWLVWKARQQGADVVDASSQVTAIHQNHTYAYHPAGAHGVWNDEQARRNFSLAGGRRHLFTIDDATHILTADGERGNPRRYWAPYWRAARPKFIPLWFAILDATRPLRRAVGLRAVAPRRSREIERRSPAG
jgi:hypothetical protein